MSKTKKAVVWGLTLVLAAVIGFGLALAVKTLRGTQMSAREWWTTIRAPREQFPGKSRLNVLLIGKDYNYIWQKNSVNWGKLHTKGARSDTLIVLSLDLNKGRVSGLSIPRDTYVEYAQGVIDEPLPRRGKINSAYAWGDAPLAMQTVSNLLNEPLDYYIALKSDAVKTLVDRLGGVEVEALDRMKYDDNGARLHIDLPAGRQTINGEQAVEFTRYRQPNAGEPSSKEDGDVRRIARQQMLLRAMVKKAKQPKMFFQADKLINTALRSVETNLSRQQIFALAALFRDLQPEQMQTGTLAGKDRHRGDKWIFVPDEEKVKAQVDWLLRGDETAAYRLTVVTVKNGTEVSGAAREVADLLRNQGFDAKSAGNARQAAAREVAQTQIQYGQAAVAPRAERIAALLGLSGVKPSKLPKEDLEGADVTVVLGRDVAPNFAPRSARR